MTDWDRALSFVLCLEGGYVDDPDDAGGATNMGITQATLDRAAARGVAAAADVRDLTRDEAAAIYRAFYWDRYGCGRIVWPASLAVFDTAVQHGRAALLIQRALCDVGERVIIDGLWGPRTAAAAERAARRDAEYLAERIVFQRAAYYGRIVRNRPSQEKFRRGWFNRLRRLAREAGVRPPA